MVFGFLFAAAAVFFFWKALVTPYKGYPEARRLVEIRKGSNTGSIMKKLQSHGVLRDDFMPLIYMKLLRRGELLKAGIYQFDRPVSPIDVIDKLARGDVILKAVVVREGLDRFAIGELMAAEGFGKAKQWREVTSDPDLIRDLDPTADSLEGFLFPDTYKLTPGTSPRAIAALMVQNFRKHFGSELPFVSTGLTLHETVTLASIVETEAQLDAERPIIASVYLNRTKKGMPLQADPTVIYAMKLSGTWKGNIRKADLQADSPYNTYRQRGFPPGPIANPGLASLRAAAAPASTPWLYFVSKNDGSHLFATTLEEHNRNVQTHQKDFFRNQNTATTTR